MGDSHSPTLGSKYTAGRAKEGHPTHSQSLESKCQAPLQLSGQSYIPSTPLSTSVCDGTQMLRTGLLSPQGPPNQGTQASSSGSYFSSCRHSRTPPLVPLIPSLIVQMQKGLMLRSCLPRVNRGGPTPWPPHPQPSLEAPAVPNPLSCKQKTIITYLPRLLATQKQVLQLQCRGAKFIIPKLIFLAYQF